MTRRQREALKVVWRAGRISSAKVADLMAIHPKAALKILTRLRQLGWVKPSPWAGSWAATEEAEKLMIVEEVMTS